MPPDQSRCFGPYRLAGLRGPLWQDAEVVAVPPKALAVLWLLVCQAGQVVPKEVLFDSVWPETVVSEGVLASCIRLLRRVLGEAPQQPHYIATVHRVGYRFVAPVTPGGSPIAPGTPLAPASPLPPLSLSPPPLFVGRQDELAQLHAGWTRALHGERQTLFVTGEAGIGKTTLVEAFLAQLEPPVPLIGRGQCIEHYGPGEAYLPLLDALGRLGRGPGGARLVTLLRQYAPTWLLQLPALCEPDDRTALQHTLESTTRTRMLREIVEALEVLTAAQPLVLVLEDLHWSDASTVELLALLARRREAVRLLVLGTYRPVEVIVHAHPLKTVKQELVAHGQAAELPLGCLRPEAVSAYLAQRGDISAEAREGVAALVYRRTEGHPLFMVQVVNDLVQQGPLPAASGGAGITAAGDTRVLTVPPGLRELLEAHLGRLGAPAQQVLEVGSVAGAEFAVASVAAGMQTAPEAVEAVCEELARQGQFLEDRGLAEWPDGTVSGRYGFRHALYQEVVYQRLGAGRRMRVHRVVGERLQQAYGVRAQEVAAELALHFRRGQDARLAVRYMQQAADTALGRYAYHEALGYLTDAVALLHTLPETPERTRQELAVQIMLGSAVSILKGYAALEVEQAYLRARQLCEQVGDARERYQVLSGLRSVYQQRAELTQATALGEECLTLARQQQDPALIGAAQQALGMIVYYRGAFVQARTYLEAGLARNEALRHRAPTLQDNQDIGVMSHSYLVWILWMLGYPAQALRRSRDNLVRARELARPISLVHTLSAVGTLHRFRREGRLVQEQAEAAMALASEHGLPFYAAWAAVLRGWAQVVQGQGEAGVAQLHHGLTAFGATGARLAQPLFLVLLAEAWAWVGQVDAGLRVLDEALAVVPQTGVRFYEAELHRLTGVLLLRQADGAVGGLLRHAESEARFQQALAIARQQQAKSLELRAATSLAQLWQQQGKHAEAHALLAPVYGWFTEGFDTADLQEAKALLEALA